MIRVGVNEPVYLSEVKKNDKGTLSVTFAEATVEAKKLSLLDQMNEGSDTSGSSAGTTQFLLFLPSREYENKVLENDKLLQNMLDFKNQLTHILKRYVKSNLIKWNVVEGLMIKSDDDLLAKMADNDAYQKIYNNIVDQFLKMAKTNKIEDPTKLSRLLLVRQSAEKHFGRMRDKFLDDQPFLEDIIIPKESSKLYVKAGTAGATKAFEADADGYVPKFTAYEIKNGKDNPIPSANTSDDNAAAPEEAEKVEGLFGKKQEEEAPMDFGKRDEEPAAETEAGE